jgi:hypothetical protein
VEGPKGVRYDLYEIFEELNFRYFHGLMARPILGWSPYASRTLLGHYDPSHNAIVLSRILDRVDTPRLAVEYVLFHEMLHLRYPAEHTGAQMCPHAGFQARGLVANGSQAKLLLRRFETYCYAGCRRCVDQIYAHCVEELDQWRDVHFADADAAAQAELRGSWPS